MAEFSDQFKEVHMVRGTPVRILSEQGLSNIVGKRVDVHMHTPATNALGRPIFSVLMNKRVVGQAEEIHLANAQMKVDKLELEKHRSNPGKGKTRNTFIRGEVSLAPETPVSNRMRIRPGEITDAETGEDISSNMGTVRLGPEGARYRR